MRPESMERPPARHGKSMLYCCLYSEQGCGQLRPTNGRGHSCGAVYRELCGTELAPSWVAGAHRQGGEGHGATTGQDPAGHGQHLGVRQGDVRQGGMSLSYSLLAMVEEAVCTHAVAFVGTKVRGQRRSAVLVQQQLASCSLSCAN